MKNLSSDVLIRILEYLSLTAKELYDLRFVSKTFNEACTNIGELNPEVMLETPICEKVFKTYYPYIPPEHKKNYKVDDPPQVELEKFRTRLSSEECYRRLQKFISSHKEYDDAGGVVDFTIFRLHDYIPLLVEKVQKKENSVQLQEAKLPVFIHKLAMVKFFEKFPEIKITNKVEREKEIIKAMEEGRKLQSYRFIDAIVLDEEEKKTDIEYLDLGKIIGDDGVRCTKDVEIEGEDNKQCKFWPKRCISRSNRYLEPLHITDLIALCCDPPYTLTDDKKPLRCEEAIRETLWENFQNLDDYDIIMWANMESDFASEFEGGRDYWGNYLVSYYVKSLNIIIIGYGNSTD